MSNQSATFVPSTQWCRAHNCGLPRVLGVGGARVSQGLTGGRATALAVTHRTLRANQMDAVIGTIIDGRYEIPSQLGSGGMGVVYRARRVLLGDDVALKMMKLGDSGPTDIDRFLRESRTLAQLRHPNIITVYDFNRDAQNRPFL